MTLLRERRYEDLLDSARCDDMSAMFLFPSHDQFEIPMAKVSQNLATKVELLDIYHYLSKRKQDLPRKLSYSSFGTLIGYHIPRSTLSSLLKREDEIRNASKVLPENAHYIVSKKNREVEEVLYRWLSEQRKLNIPVN
ncbi:hypothetical protein BGZ76_007233, partial [Entomortierella beljakovae]